MWDIKDATRMRKGLNVLQVQKWLHAANTALSRCGMEDRAIKIADAVVGAVHTQSSTNITRMAGLVIHAFTHDSIVDEHEPQWSNVDQSKLPNQAFADPKLRLFAHHWVRGGVMGDDGRYSGGTLVLHSQGAEMALRDAQASNASPSVLEHFRRHEDIPETQEHTTKTDDSTESHRLKCHMSSLIRRENFDGKEHLVIPMIMMTPGVRNEILYTEKELEKFPQSWNGRPVVTYHPRQLNGAPKSASNDPSTFEAVKIGYIFNCEYDVRTGLKAEAWIDPERANAVGGDLLQLLEMNENIDVSIGVFQEEIKEEGEQGGKNYSSIALNLRPDHLAVLPGGVGGCTWEEGAGLPRLQQEEGMKTKRKRTSTPGDENGVTTMVSDIVKAVSSLVGHELSHGHIHNELSDAIRASLNLREGDYAYVVEVFGDYFIYEHARANEESQLFKLKYVVNENNIEIDDSEPQQVERKTEYVTVTNQSSTKGPSTQTQTQGGKMNKKDKIDGLIAQQRWPEADRAVLDAMDDESFLRVYETLSADSDDKTVTKQEPEPVVQVRDPKKVEAPTIMSAEDWLAQSDLPPEIASTLRQSLRAQDEQKQTLIKGIMGSPTNTFTDAFLRTQSLDALKGMADLARVPVYGVRPSGQEGSLTTQAQSEAALAPPSLWGDDNKDKE